MHSFVFTCFLLLQAACLFSSVPVSTLKAGLSTHKDCSTEVFFRAAKFGELDKLELCMGQEQDVNAKDRDGKTALIILSEHGENLLVVQYLVQQGADVNIKDTGGLTALSGASCRGYLPVVQYLVQQGADVNIKDKSGWTALMCASKWNRLPVVEYLAQKGADLKTAKEVATGEVKNNWSSVTAIAAHRGK